MNLMEEDDGLLMNSIALLCSASARCFNGNSYIYKSFHSVYFYNH